MVGTLGVTWPMIWVELQYPFSFSPKTLLPDESYSFGFSFFFFFFHQLDIYRSYAANMAVWPRRLSTCSNMSEPQPMVSDLDSLVVAVECMGPLKSKRFLIFF